MKREYPSHISPLTLLEAHSTGFGLLVEQDGWAGLDLNPDLLNEGFEVGPNNTVTVNCILQKSNTLNRNGRVYPRAILEREVRKYQELIDAGSALGECNHPSEITVDLNNVSHRVVKVWWDGDTLYGKLEIIVSPQFAKRGEIGPIVGDKLAHYLQLGVKLGISSRGIGSVKTIQGKNYVQDDFELVCFDLVSSPSTPNAYLFPEEQQKQVMQVNEGIIDTTPKLVTSLRGFDAKLADFLKTKK